MSGTKDTSQEKVFKYFSYCYTKPEKCGYLQVLCRSHYFEKVQENDRDYHLLIFRFKHVLNMKSLHCYMIYTLLDKIMTDTGNINQKVTKSTPFYFNAIINEYFVKK